MSQGKKQSVRQYWCSRLEKSLPGQFSGNFCNPTFSWELSLNSEVEERGLFVFPFNDFFFKLAISTNSYSTTPE